MFISIKDILLNYTRSHRVVFGHTVNTSCVCFNKTNAGKVMQLQGPSEVALRVNGYLSAAWQEMAACCSIAINGELLFFHLGMITQGSRPDRHEPRPDRLIDEDNLRDARVKTWTITDPRCGWSVLSGIVVVTPL